VIPLLAGMPPRLDRRLVILEVGDRATYERQHIAGAHFLASSDRRPRVRT